MRALSRIFRFLLVAGLIAGSFLASVGVAIFMGGKTEARPWPLAVSLTLALTLAILALRLWARFSPPQDRSRAINLGVGMFAFFAAAAIVFPVFASAQEASTKTACFSNLKQVGVGMLMYAGDNNETLPP